MRQRKAAHIAGRALPERASIGICRDDSGVTRIKQRKTPGSFLPGVLLESRQTIGIRSYAERER